MMHTITSSKAGLSAYFASGKSPMQKYAIYASNMSMELSLKPPNREIITVYKHTEQCQT